MNPRSCLAVALAATAAIGAGAAAAQERANTAAPAAAAAQLRAEPVPPAVDAAFRAWDTDDDSALSLSEFRNGWRAMKRGPRRTAGAGLRRQFDRLDANDNGGIDRTEYPDLMLVKRAGSLAPPFSEVDSNGSQKLEFDEYGAVVRRLREAAKATPSP